MPSDEETPKVETGREFGAGDRHLETGLVRQASIGKRGKPSLTTIRNSDNGASKSPAVPSARSMLPSQTPQAWEKETNRTAINSPLGNGSVLLDPSSSDETLGKEVDGAVRYMPSRESLRQEKLSSPDMMHPKNYVVSPRSYRSPVSHSGSRSPLFVTDGGDRAFKEMDGASIHSAESANDLQRPGSTLGNRVSSRGPSRMNLDASRESEVRSSMTSLPDLIRRATRLAANLDRGRTASRLGFNWALEDGARTPNSEGSGHGRQRKSQASLSGMLDSFPPPAQTPTSPRTEWPSTNQSSFVPPNKRFYPDEKREKRSLRESCINMRRWKFFLILVILLVCIALAVAIPVTLIVVPRMSASTDKSSAASGSALCKAAIVCQNGGSSVLLQSGGCGCLCTNGYTGPRCTNLSDAGCATTSSGSFQNATVGSQIPDLLRQAGPVFGVPLEGDKVLDIFARMNLTCSGENALITLTGSSNEKRVAKDQQVRRLRRTPTQIASTSNGIVIAASTTSAYTATATSTPVSTAAPGTNKTSRTFARIGVLYVLQESLQLEVALKAQEKLSSYMMTATKQGSTVDYARNITLGNGYAIDLWFFSIKTANGTKVGVGALGNGTKPATKGRRGLLF
ncbi:hypothetical protein EJ06DRAFT_556755 [Trichodelitschia bisporula]|uniref:EGF-like domain-containing protein n=1 Tax=Trichodelitschia bisporula TaxID=703511 RepID=A0A6G1HWR6_9PEZI|nr:hypothetical protein EJ06DRAFT_556755 [Trichodelitschia bisporula]